MPEKLSQTLPAGGRRAAQKLATRLALIEAARSEFIANGYSATRIEDIAAHAQASPATYYLHFSTKSELAMVFFEELRVDANEYYGQLDAVAYTGTTSAIAQWIEATLARWEVLGPLARVVVEASTVEPTIFNAQQRVIDDGILAIINGLQRSKRITDGSEQSRAILAMSLHEGSLNEYLRRESFGNLDQIKQILTRMWHVTLNP